MQIMMSAQIIDGKAIAQKILDQIQSETEQLIQKYQRKPSLHVILVGEDSASQIYVQHKITACERIGFDSQTHRLDKNILSEDVLHLINQLNQDDQVDGILLQLPLPKHLDANQMINVIDPKKDVDALHPYNMGCLATRQTPYFYPCTPSGIIRLLKQAILNIAGSHAVIIGQSNIVGRPLALMLLNENVTVTICHKQTQNLASICQTADILISATGAPHLVKADWVKPGAIVIDVGIYRNAQNQILGDVDFEQVKQKASAITPVPGGVGPMTIACLMQNTLHAFKTHQLS